MEVVILSKAHYDELKSEIKTIKDYLKKIAVPSEAFMDNKDFLKLMKVSDKTAQRWRVQGKIGYSQIAGKIYYRLSDIDEFLAKTHRKAFFKFRPKPFDFPDVGSQGFSMGD